MTELRTEENVEAVHFDISFGIYWIGEPCYTGISMMNSVIEQKRTCELRDPTEVGDKVFVCLTGSRSSRKIFTVLNTAWTSATPYQVES